MSAQRFLVVVVVVLGSVGFCCTSCCNKQSDYAKPESFIRDADTGAYYVSNVNGSTYNDGYITKLDKDLKIVKQKFVEGTKAAPLDDPKGMAIVGDTLWVADKKVMRAYNKETGESVAQIPLQQRGARFLNGVEAGPDGVVFVSDMDANIIYTINTKDSNAVDVLTEGAGLSKPNGLYWDDASKILYVACWEGGRIVTVDLQGAITTFVEDTAKFTNLDGIDGDGEGNLYVSDYTKGIVYRVTPAKQIETVTDKVKTPADIHVDRPNKRLLIPQFTANKISTHDLTKDQ